MHQHLKRETSVSVSDLHLSSVSDSIKRLALSRDGHPVPMALSLKKPESNFHVLSVMSNARDDFTSRYELIREIGKGGFSTVYQCRNRQTGQDYAVKVVDLRPLRLRERFNPSRLKREVDIMRRLNHPNIIQFIEVYEDADHLMMVMEFCPGHELFDVILARKFFHEEDAKPIFAQVARALFYLHSLNIIHRDIKPENILILNTPDPKTGGLIAKLLDFGLSKNAGAGSAAKTFVGTPCYLAPEVEYTSKGLGGTYGLPADCWSLGAVLYVMLVARFPEFEQDKNGKVVVKLPPALWNNISSEAKDLIRSLMNTNPNARMTMAGALMHPWLGKYRASEAELTSVSVANSNLSQHLQEEEELAVMEEVRRVGGTPEIMDPELTAGGTVIRHQAMVVRQSDVAQAVPVANRNNNISPEQLKLQPLLHLQRSIATCFEEAHAQYQDHPEVSSQIRRGAVLCRHQLIESTKMLRKVENTAKEVLEMFPDLELAVEEEEPKLAAEFFNLVKGWVVELREQVMTTQKINKASMNQIQRVVEQSTIDLKESESSRSGNSSQLAKQLLDALLTKLKNTESTENEGQSAVVNFNGDAMNVQDGQGINPEDPHLDSSKVLELFFSLFGASLPVNQAANQNQNRANQNQATMDLDASFSNNNDEGNDLLDTSFSPIAPQPTRAAPNTTANPQFTNTSPGRGSGQISGDYGLPQGSYLSNSVSSSTSSFSSTSTTALFTQPSLPSSSSSVVNKGQSEAQLMPPQPPSQQQQQSQQSRHQRLQIEVDSMNNSLDHEEGYQAPNTLVTQRDAAANMEIAASGHTRNSPRTAHRLAEALHKLRQVDVILEQLGIFWANTEVVLDLLTKKGQHVEQFIGFASKPRLMARFRERMEEYKRFWEGIRLMCANYVAGIQVTNENQKMYGFLEKNHTGGSGGGDSATIGSTGKGDSLDSLGGGIGGSNTSNFSGLSGLDMSNMSNLSSSGIFGEVGLSTSAGNFSGNGMIFDNIEEFNSLKVRL